MAEFFAELKRRQMFRVAAAYAVVAWLLLQIVNNVAPVLDLPVWVARAILLLLVIGFPIALLFVWMRELAPTDGGTPRTTTTRLDYVLAGALIIVIALVSYQQLSRSPSASAPPGPSLADAGSISVAVLPFENLSGDAAQKFFSDGMTEEIAAALAKIPNLRLVARLSVFEDNESRDIAALRQAFNVSYLIGGSVRRDGDRVRITARLVQTDNGVNIWTESYDRQLAGVFDTQEDIARAIAEALRVPLGLEQGQRLVSSSTNDLESYQQYLRARALLRARDVDRATILLEGVVARDPNYARAWGLLARAYTLGITYNDALLSTGSPEQQRFIRETIRGKAENAAREAMRLDPTNPLGYTGLVGVEVGQGRRAEAEDLLRQALKLDPNDPDVLDRYSQFLRTGGRIREALRLSEQLRMLEPFVPIFNIVGADIMRLSGQHDAAIPILEPITASGVEVGVARNLVLARAYAAAGRYREAADALVAIPTNQNRVPRQSVEDAARLLRSAPGKADTVPELGNDLAFVYPYVGALDRVLENLERTQEINGPNGWSSDYWSPEYAPIRKTDGFKAVARAAGMVAYWRVKGWPDLCRPVGVDDFVCD